MCPHPAGERSGSGRCAGNHGDGIICGICGVDAAGRAVTPYINYLDSRTKEDADEINSWNLDIWGRETGNPEANCMFPALFAPLVPETFRRVSGERCKVCP